MGLFSDCLFGCDIDGTLLVNGIINPRNIEKIEYFMNEGGNFSLSTGRTVGAVGPVLSKLKRVSPSIVSNGCMIYDYENKKVLDELYVPKSDYFIVKKVLDMGLNVGIEVHSGDKVLTVFRNAETDIHQEYEWLESITVSFEEASRYRWNKVVMMFEKEEALIAVKKMIAGEETQASFVDTSAVIAGKRRRYYEQFPKGVSKASALDKLTKILNIKKGGLFAIGDYYNDLEMIKKADISAVPAGTPRDIEIYADYIACRCEDGAVADFIDYLSKKKGMI